MKIKTWEKLEFIEIKDNDGELYFIPKILEWFFRKHFSDLHDILPMEYIDSKWRIKTEEIPSIIIWKEDEYYQCRYFYHLWYKEYRQCDCGESKDRFEFVQKILSLKETNIIKKAIEIIYSEDNTIVSEFVFGIMYDILDHGGWIGASWISKEGKDFLKADLQSDLFKRFWKNMRQDLGQTKIIEFVKSFLKEKLENPDEYILEIFKKQMEKVDKEIITIFKSLN